MRILAAQTIFKTSPSQLSREEKPLASHHRKSYSHSPVHVYWIWIALSLKISLQNARKCLKMIANTQTTPTILILKNHSDQRWDFPNLKKHSLMHLNVLRLICWGYKNLGFKWENQFWEKDFLPICSSNEHWLLTMLFDEVLMVSNIILTRLWFYIKYVSKN